MEILNKVYWKLNNRRRYGTFDFFNSVEIETITMCNRRCIHCPNHYYDRGTYEKLKLMDERLYFKIIDELAGFNYNGLICPHFYGEPLLDKRLPNLLEYTREKLPNCKIVIHTNGDLLTIDLYKTLIHSVTRFVVTQYDPDMKENIKELIGYRKKNQDDISFDYRKVGEINLNNRSGLIKLSNTKNRVVCHIPSNILTIDYNGNIILCCNDYFSNHRFGNLKDESIMDIWNKEDFIESRKWIREGEFKLKICQDCELLR